MINTSWKQRRFLPSLHMRKKKTQRRRKAVDRKHKKGPTDETSRSSGPKELQSEGLLDEMVAWLSDRRQEVDQLLALRDPDRNGSVSLEDFELGLMSLDVPCQQLELHTLAELLRNADNTISYGDLSRRVQRLSESSAEVSASSEEERMKRRCVQDQQSSPQKERFVRLKVRLIPFESSAAHPGNFEVVVPSRSKVFSLIRIIQDRVGIQTSRLEVFQSRLPPGQACLPPESSLEECGFGGGPEERPPEDTVYYDYRLLFTDCPLLNCDHYFSSKPDSAARRTGH